MKPQNMLLCAIIVLIGSYHASAVGISSRQPAQLVLLAQATPIDQLNRIYNDAFFVKTAYNLEVLIGKLDDLLKANPELKTTTIQGTKLTGDTLREKFSVQLIELRKQESETEIQSVLSDVAYNTLSNIYNPNAEGIANDEDKLGRLIVTLQDQIQKLNDLFKDYPEARDTQIESRGQKLTGNEILQINQKRLSDAKANLEKIRQADLSAVRQEFLTYISARNPYESLNRAQKEAASKSVTDLQKAGYSYKNGIRTLEAFQYDLQTFVTKNRKLEDEVISVNGKSQSVKAHLLQLPKDIEKARQEFKAFEPKWNAAITEFDKQTKAMLKQLLKGDRKAIFAARGWPSRFEGNSLNADPKQLVQALVKAASWQYSVENTNTGLCIYTYIFKGDDLLTQTKTGGLLC
jgi:hypothetical protein